MRQQLVQWRHHYSCWRRFCDVNGNVLRAELRQGLSTCAARRRKLLLLIGYHGDSFILVESFANCLAYGSPFGADTWPKGAILNITPGDNFASLGSQCCPDGKVTVRAVGVVAYLDSGIDQLMHFCICCMQTYTGWKWKEKKKTGLK